MTLDEFRDKYCGMCGSQRCLASDEDIAECGYNPDSKDPLEDVLKAVKGGMNVERLTYSMLRDSENQAHESEYSRETLLHRLAAYEDTGLSPDEVARLREDARWVSVEDEAPYADTDYEVRTVAFIPSGDDYWVPSTDDGRMVVTHYRPLPQGPEVERCR